MLLLEHWKPIVGFEGAYDISNTGCVRNSLTDKRRKASIGKCGYPSITLRNSRGELRTRYVHTLVALTFIGDRPDGFQINHIDGWKRNARVSNLEFISPSDNIRHAFLLGLIARQAKLTQAQREEIFANPSNLSNAALSRKYGVHESYISRTRKAKGLKPAARPRREKRKVAAKRIDGRVYDASTKAIKLTPIDVIKIRKRAAVDSVSSIARDYRLNRSNVYQILRGDIWGHI